MILSWMLYALAVGLLVSLAALAAERALILLRRPVRGVWAVALGLSLLIPALAHFIPRRLSVLAPMERVMTVTRDAMAAPVVRLRQDNVSSWWPAREIDRALLIGWIALSAGVVQLVLYSMAVLHGRRREWKRQRVDGVEALISPDFGPAVVGWRRLEIVLPEWTLDLPPDARSLVVRHEQEHVTRGDPRLLLHAFLLVIAMSWNPFLWWQYRRLRRAIELDCDARVVGSGVPVARYGEVLLEAVGFCRNPGLPALASFVERAKDLEARIEALTARVPRHRALRVAVAGVMGIMLGVAACVMPDPLSPASDVPPQALAVAAGSSPAVQWVRRHLAERGPATLVVVVQSSTGELLGIESSRRLPDGRLLPEPFRTVRDLERGGGIGSIEVVKGNALQIPGLEGVVVISLKPGVVLRPAAAPAAVKAPAIGGVTLLRSRSDLVPTLGWHVRQYGRWSVYFAGLAWPPRPTRSH